MLRKRYTSQAQILHEIDVAHAQIENLNRLAEGKEIALRNMRDSMWDRAQAESLQKEAETYRAEAARIERDKLKRLGEALAEYQTSLLAFETDATVPAIPWKNKVF